MAERPPPDYMKAGHIFDRGPITLDLYRLLSMVLVDQRMSGLASKSHFIDMLREEYLGEEITRILISSAAALRIWFDLHDPRYFADLKTNCGKLFADWPTRSKKSEVLTLREACNKIIHATRVHHDTVGDPEYEDWYLRPYVYLYGKKGKRNWRAQLDIVNFAKWGTAALWWWRHKGEPR